MEQVTTNNGGQLEAAALEGSQLASRIATRIRSNAPLVALDLVGVVVAYLVTLVVRLEGAVDPRYWRSFWLWIPLIALVHLACNFAFGLYGQMWRYASVQEARKVAFSGLTAAAAVILLVEIASAAQPR